MPSCTLDVLLLITLVSHTPAARDLPAQHPHGVVDALLHEPLVLHVQRAEGVLQGVPAGTLRGVLSVLRVIRD